MRKLTTAKFIENAKKVHGDDYDYSETEYNGSECMVKIICKVHGPFHQRAQNHVSLGRGCSECNGVSLCRKMNSYAKQIKLTKVNMTIVNQYMMV